MGFLLRGLYEGLPTHAFLFGPPGTGKTSITGKLIQLFEEQARRDRRTDIRYNIVNCRNKKYLAVLGEILRKYDKTATIHGIAASDILDKIKEHTRGRSTCFIFDEMDKIVPTSEYSQPLEKAAGSFTRLWEGEFDLESRTQFIIIANNQDLDEDLPTDVMSTFTPRRIEFRPYSPVETTKILLERCRRGFQENIIDEEATAGLSKKLCDGDAYDLRTGMKVLLEAGRKIREDKREKITKEDLNIALNEIERATFSERISALTDTQLAAVFVIVYLIKNNPQDKEIANPDTVRKTFKSLNKKLKIEITSDKYLFEHVMPRVEDQHLIYAGKKAMGRGKGWLKTWYVNDSYYDSIIEGTYAEVEKRFGVQIRNKRRVLK